MRYKAIIEYNGKAYKGYAKQKNEITIQEVIEEKLSIILREEIRIYASGRTDAGVHAKGQVIHFDTNNELIVKRILKSINSILPLDIRFISLEKVDDDFHARYDVKTKTYLYRIYLGDASVFEKDFCYEIHRKFDIELFKETLSIFIGKHDFKNFTSKKEDEDNFIREIYSIDVKENDKNIDIYLTGNGFMRYMVRDIIGSAIEVAMKRTDIDVIKNHLDSKKREILSYKAPACGLFLMKVNY